MILWTELKKEMAKYPLSMAEMLSSTPEGREAMRYYLSRHKKVTK